MGLTKLTVTCTWVVLLFSCTLAYPQTSESERREPRQEDEDEPSASTLAPINFGAQVAQIITGALSGNIDSIIKGSFGFIQDSNVNRLSHNTWETLKGNPTETPPWQTTTTKVPRPTEEAKPQSEAHPQPPAAGESSPSSPSAPQRVQPASLPASPEINYSSSASQGSPTRPPTRTTQPTYATLAPLSVVEGVTTYDSENSSTNPPTSTDADDEDEAESAEVLEASTPSAGTKESVTSATEASETTVVIEVESTTEDDEDIFENLIYQT